MNRKLHDIHISMSYLLKGNESMEQFEFALILDIVRFLQLWNAASQKLDLQELYAAKFRNQVGPLERANLDQWPIWGRKFPPSRVMTETNSFAEKLSLKNKLDSGRFNNTSNNRILGTIIVRL
jgi:hypothetical protein